MTYTPPFQTLKKGAQPIHAVTEITMPSTTTGLTTAMMDSGAETVNETMEDTASETIVTAADLPSGIDQECIYMTSEDEADGEAANSTSPDDTPIMMTHRMPSKGPTTFELPIRRNAAGGTSNYAAWATSNPAIFSVATDSPNNDVSASGSNGMPPTAIITMSELSPKIIKACVFVMLNRVITIMLQEVCNGCVVDHPSQLQHRCLFEEASMFYTDNSDRVKTRLYQTSMLQVLTHVCTTKGVIPLKLRMLGAVDMILWELAECEVGDYHINAPYDFIDGPIGAVIEAAMEACWLQH